MHVAFHSKSFGSRPKKLTFLGRALKQLDCFPYRRALPLKSRFFPKNVNNIQNALKNLFINTIFL